MKKNQNNIDKYTQILWNDQLPEQEESLLLSILSEQQTTGIITGLNSDFSLYLAYNAQKHGFSGYGKEQVSDYKAILYTYKKQILQKIPTMSKVFKLLNENGITPILVKGAAFLCFYSPNIPRMMDDIDIYIQPEQFDKALSIIYSNGFSFVNDTGYHIAVTSPSLDIDVHRYIYVNGGDIGSDIYDRLIPCSFLGSNVFVLSPEDMLVHQLANRGKDVCASSHDKRHIKWIVDCYSVLGFFQPDLNSIIQKAKAVNNLFYTELTLFKLVSLFPEKFANHTINFQNNEYCKFLRAVAHKTRVMGIFKNKEINGIKALFQIFIAQIEYARIYRTITKSKKPILFVMFELKEIHSFKDFIYQFGRFIEKSKK